MRRSFPRLRTGAVLSIVSLVACHRMDWSPAQIDQFYAGCRERLDRNGGARPVTPGDHVGLRAPADPRGTPIVIYGASWCGACHVAAQYLARRSIPFVEKDVEEDPAAKQAADAALAAASLGGQHGLPVMDVRGTVMIGFLPCLVEQAWAAP
jgi:glutaredoxin